MSDERSTTINLPLVQSSGSFNNSTANGNDVNSQQTPQSPGVGGSSSGGNSSGSCITVQTALPGSNSFSVGTKANQSIISDAPVTDPGGSTTKQVISVSTTYHPATIFDSYFCFSFSSTLSNFSFERCFVSFYLFHLCFLNTKHFHKQTKNKDISGSI